MSVIFRHGTANVLLDYDLLADAQEYAERVEKALEERDGENYTGVDTDDRWFVGRVIELAFKLVLKAHKHPAHPDTEIDFTHHDRDDGYADKGGDFSFGDSPELHDAKGGAWGHHTNLFVPFAQWQKAKWIYIWAAVWHRIKRDSDPPWDGTPGSVTFYGGCSKAYFDKHSIYRDRGDGKKPPVWAPTKQLHLSEFPKNVDGVGDMSRLLLKLPRRPSDSSSERSPQPPADTPSSHSDQPEQSLSPVSH